MTDCLGPDELRRLLEDRLDGPSREAAEAHIEGCRRCQGALELMAAGEGLGPQTIAAEAADDSDLVRRIKEHGPLSDSPNKPLPWRTRTGTIDPRVNPLIGNVARSDRGFEIGNPLPSITGFRLIREIGRGGMGTVYEAIEIALGRKVALKVLPRSASSTSTTIERFRREARAAARLHHTNIVPVFGVGEDAGHLFYAMQLIEGEGLDQVLNRLRNEQATPPSDTTLRSVGLPEDPTDPAGSSGLLANEPGSGSSGISSASSGLAGGSSKWSADSATSIPMRCRIAARIGMQVAEGLEFAHRRGILHRDVKPSNILIDEAGAAWVADFGLAKAIDAEAEALTQTGDIVGTLRYMAPERFEGKSDARGDIYSLGIALYELLTLRPAFDEPNRHRLIERLLRDDPPRPRSIDRGIPRDLETIVLKAIAKEPGARYPSAGTMATDLRLFLAGEPILARRIGTAERGWRWARRNPVVSGLTAAVILTVSVGFSLTFWKWREAAEQNVRAVRAELDMGHQRDQAISARREARSLAANLTLDRGLSLLADGDWMAGRHWVARSLEAPELPPESRRLARLNLSAWSDVSPRLVRILAGPRPFHAVAFSPDGTVMNALDDDGVSLRCYSLANGEEIGDALQLPPFAEGDRDIFIDPGSLLWSQRAKGNFCQIIDAATGNRGFGPMPMVKVGGENYLHKSPDSSALAVTIAADRIAVLQAKTGRRLGPPIDVGPISNEHFALSPGGRTLVTVGPDGGRFWDVATGTLAGKATLMSPRVERIHYDPLGGIATLETSRPEISGLDIGWVLRFWDGSGRPVGEAQPMAGPIPDFQHFEFSPEGTSLAVIDHYGRLGLYDCRRGKRKEQFLGTSSFVRAIAFSPDGTTLASGTIDGQTQLWNVASGHPRPVTIPQPGPIRALHFSPDGRRLAVHAHDGTARIWQLPDRPIPEEGANGPNRRLVVDGGATFAPGGGHALILGPRQNANRIVASDNRPVGGPLQRAWPAAPLLASSPDGRRWATASHDPNSIASELRLWDAEGRPIGDSLAHRNWIVRLAFSKDGKTLAATGYGGRVWLYDAETGKPARAPLRIDRVGMSLAFSPDRRLLAVGTGPSSPVGLSVQLQLWDYAAGRLERTVDLPEWATGLTFSPDGRSLLVRFDHTLYQTSYTQYRIWDVATLSPRGEPLSCPAPPREAVVFLQDHRLLTRGPGGVWEWDFATSRPSRLAIPMSGSVQALAADPSARWIVSLNEAGAAQLYDASTYRAVGPLLRAEQPIVGLSFTDDGKSIVAAVDGFRMRTWRIPEASPDPEGQASEPEEIRRLAIATGASFDEHSGSVTTLSTSEWLDLSRDLGAEPEEVESEPEQVRRLELFADAAEAEGNPLAALWHLDRLAKLRPGDWTVLARRSQALANDGQLGRAEAELAGAASLAPRGAIRDWQSCRSIDARNANRPDLALWYANRLVADDPNDWRVLAERAEIHDILGQVDRRNGDLERAAGLGMSSTLVGRHAERLGGSNQWPEAAAILGKADRRDDQPSELRSYQLTIASLMARNQRMYREACRRSLDLARRRVPNFTPGDTAYLCAIGPRALDDYTESIAMATEALAAIKASDKLQRHWTLNTLGALLVRSGETSRAIRVLQEGIAGDGDPNVAQDHAFLALAYLTLGDRPKAKQHLEHLARIKPTGDFWQLSEVVLLRREVEERLGELPLELPADVFAPGPP